MLHVRIIRHLPARARHTHWLDLGATMFYGVIFAVMEMVAGLAIRLLNAGGLAQYVLRAAQPATLLLTVGLAGLTIGRRKLPFIIYSRLLASAVLLVAAFAAEATFFAALMVLFYLALHTSLPVVNAIYKENYPDAHRHALVGNGRAMGMLSGAFAGWFAGRYIDGLAFLPGLLAAGDVAPSHEEMLLRFRVVLVLVDLSLLCSMLFVARMRLASDEAIARGEAVLPGDAASGLSPAPGSDMPLARRLVYGLRHLRDDPDFRRFMVGYFLFGFAAQMQQPVVDNFLAVELHASATDMGLAYAALPLVFGFLTIGLWARYLDRSDPVTGRIVFNVVWLVPMLLTVVATLLPRDGALATMYARGVALGFARSGSSLLWLLSTIPFARRPEDVVTYSAIGMMLTGVRGLFAPATGLLLYHELGWTARDVFLLTVALVLWSTVVLLRLRRDTAGRFAPGAGGAGEPTIVVETGAPAVARTALRR